MIELDTQYKPTFPPAFLAHHSPLFIRRLVVVAQHHRQHHHNRLKLFLDPYKARSRCAAPISELATADGLTRSGPHLHLNN